MSPLHSSTNSRFRCQKTCRIYECDIQSLQALAFSICVLMSGVTTLSFSCHFLFFSAGCKMQEDEEWLEFLWMADFIATSTELDSLADCGCCSLL